MIYKWNKNNIFKQAMKIQVEIYILIEIIFTVFYAKCHNELTFLKDIEEKYQVQELIITNNSGNNENIFSTNTQNLKGSSEELNKIIPDYDMYVVSIQWGSKKILIKENKLFLVKNF